MNENICILMSEGVNVGFIDEVIVVVLSRLKNRFKRREMFWKKLGIW